MEDLAYVMGYYPEIREKIAELLAELEGRLGIGSVETGIIKMIASLQKTEGHLLVSIQEPQDSDADRDEVQSVKDGEDEKTEEDTENELKRMQKLAKEMLVGIQELQDGLVSIQERLDRDEDKKEESVKDGKDAKTEGDSDDGHDGPSAKKIRLG